MRTSGLREDRGSATLELALITPALLLVLLFVVTLGRVATAQEDVDDAAAQAARAASVVPDPAQARGAAREAASAAVAAKSLPCSGLDVVVDTSAFHPGGVIAVDVSCPVGLGRLAGMGLPGSKVLTSRAVEVIDTYRGQP